jgi:protein TonB
MPANLHLRLPSRVGAITAIALHTSVIVALLSYAPARSALLDVAPIMVDWISAPVATPAPPLRSKPVAKHPPAKPVDPTPPTATETPSPIVAPTPPAAPPEPVASAPTAAPVTVTPPVFNAAYLDNQPPAYPQLSRRLGEQGRVILRVLVNIGGSAEEVQLRASSGSARLDESARAAVSRWKFVPAKRGGEAVPEWVLIPISFKLEG